MPSVNLGSIKILMFCPYYPPHVGGLEAYAEELTTHLLLNKKIVEVTVFAPLLPNNIATNIGTNKATICLYPAIEIIPNYPIPAVWHPRFWAAYAQINAAKPNITISHTRFFLSSLLALRYATKHRLPLVHIEHGSSPVRSNSRLVVGIARLYDHVIGRKILKQSTVNIAISKAVSEFIKRYDNRKPIVIYRGFDQEKIKNVTPDSSLTSKYEGNTTIITFAGRLISGKGVQDLLLALRSASDNYHCFIVGDGPYRSYLEKRVKEYSLTNRVTLTGFLPHEKVLSLLRASDIFVNPSHSEGLPTSVIEAGLCGASVIATDVGGTNEIIENGKTGILVKPMDHDELSQSITKLINDPKYRQEISLNAQKLIGSQFGWAKSINHFIDVFQRCIG